MSAKCNFSVFTIEANSEVARLVVSAQNKNQPQFRSEYNVYSTFQSHEPEFDYLKSLEIEEKINKIRWLPQKNAAQFLLSTNGEFVDSSGQPVP